MFMVIGLDVFCDIDRKCTGNALQVNYRQT